MKAKKLEELLVYQKALDGVVEVSALLTKPSLGRDFDPRDQLSESSGRIPGHIAEGYGQLTDRHGETPGHGRTREPGAVRAGGPR